MVRQDSILCFKIKYSDLLLKVEYVSSCGLEKEWMNKYSTTSRSDFDDVGYVVFILYTKKRVLQWVLFFYGSNINLCFPFSSIS